jgi:Putative MetA-pathway of phenol degradation
MKAACLGTHALSGTLVFSLRCALLALILATVAVRTLGSDMGDMGEAAAPDKSGYTLFDPTPDAELRDFNTDRPPKANSPYTVDAGHFQYETDLAVFSYSGADGGRTDAWTVVDPTLKIGVNNSIDAELQLTPYQSFSTDIAGNATTISGLGDTYARLKINVLGDDHGAVAVALLPYIKLPTAQSGLGNGKVEGGLILPMSFSAPGGFTVIVMPEGDYLKDNADSGYHGAVDFLINVSHALDQRWTLYSEVFTTQSFKGGDKPIYTADAALTCALRSNLQLDFGGNFSLNNVGPQTQLYVGLSQRF